MADSVKTLAFTFGGIVVCVTFIGVFLRAVGNICSSLKEKDWRVIVWNVVVSIISVACCLACLFSNL